MFEDRCDAGGKLAKALERYRNKDVVVLAIPRGGVQVGYEVARHLKATFSMLVARKLPFPDEPEGGFGAVAEDGSTFVIEDARAWLPKETIDRVIIEQKRESQRRIDVLRESEPLPAIEDRIVILVDDGMAMGSTMRAAIEMCKKKKVGKIVVAVPVTGEDQARQIGKIVDEIVVLEKPPLFRAVAQAYRNWYDVSDEEVIEIMRQWQKEH